MFLYEKIDGAREYNAIKPVPKYIPENLNPALNLREYQKAAFENFVTHFEKEDSPRPLQVLFHMATGSGKTLIMAGLITDNLPVQARLQEFSFLRELDKHFG